MLKVTIKDGKSFEAAQGTLLILALADNGINVWHKCGGKSRCTRCRIIFHEGEPEKMTVAEHDKLESEENMLGVVRLSCQITVENDIDSIGNNKFLSIRHDVPCFLCSRLMQTEDYPL